MAEQLLRTRDLVIRQRAMAVQQIRSFSKLFGCRLPDASTRTFARKVRELVPAILLPAVNPLLALIDTLSAMIKDLDRQLAECARQRYPEAERLQQVPGVGPITAIAFVLTIEDPARLLVRWTGRNACSDTLPGQTP